MIFNSHPENATDICSLSNVVSSTQNIDDLHIESCSIHSTSRESSWYIYQSFCCYSTADNV